MGALVKPQEPEHCTLPIDCSVESAQEFHALCVKRQISMGDMFALMVRSFAGRNQTLGLTDVVRFGKYAGHYVEHIVRGDPRYVRWLIAESTTIDFTDEVHDLLDELDPPKKRRRRSNDG